MGRKLAFMIGILLMCGGGIGMAFATNYWTFVGVQFISAFGEVGVFQTGFVLGVESVGKDYRVRKTIESFIAALNYNLILLAPCSSFQVFCGIVFEYFFVIGELLLTLVAWATRDWKKILWMGMAPSAIFLIYWPFMPESTRWYLTKKKFDKAQEQVLIFSCHLSGICISTDLILYA